MGPPTPCSVPSGRIAQLERSSPILGSLEDSLAGRDVYPRDWSPRPAGWPQEGV